MDVSSSKRNLFGRELILFWAFLNKTEKPLKVWSSTTATHGQCQVSRKLNVFAAIFPCFGSCWCFLAAKSSRFAPVFLLLRSPAIWYRRTIKTPITDMLKSTLANLRPLLQIKIWFWLKAWLTKINILSTGLEIRGVLSGRVRIRFALFKKSTSPVGILQNLYLRILFFCLQIKTKLFLKN